jgi:hypothetical protein
MVEAMEQFAADVMPLNPVAESLQQSRSVKLSLALAQLMVSTLDTSKARARPSAAAT